MELEEKGIRQSSRMLKSCVYISSEKEVCYVRVRGNMFSRLIKLKSWD